MPAPGNQAEKRRFFGEISAIMAELEEISGLDAPARVRYDTITRPELRRYLERKIQEEVKPEEIRADELALKKFGFVPPDYDLKESTVDLLTEQAAAFYDFRARKLFVLESASGALDQIALVHELAHALADQNFRLAKFIKRGESSDDDSLAHVAVMEGQASWLTGEYLARMSGQSLKTSPALLERMSRSADDAAGQFPVLKSAPLYIRETLLFPYTAGMRFQNAVLEKFGFEGFRRVFKNPPVTTQQILHPQKYFDAILPTRPRPPELPKAASYRSLTEGSVGELDHEILLRQYIGEDAARLAERWRGGSFELFEHRKTKEVVLAYAVEWNETSDARRYFELYRRILAAKWKTFHPTEESEAAVAGEGDGGHFRVELIGKMVTSLEGLPSAIK
ncbi:MAG: hypothetical protein HUU41_03520 [Bryobacteraceae bacterium]|nr:hypothetical protein [Bryobacterales bacterium]NUN00161.1 hypothetical protein [Bryobacteraceae bacterium]